MSWSTMRLLELNFVWLHKDQVLFPQGAPEIIEKQILAEHCYSLRKSSKPHENVGISKTSLHFIDHDFYQKCLWSLNVKPGHEATVLEGVWPFFFNLWTVQRQKKSSVVVSPYAVPSFIIYSSNLLSMEIQAHGSRTLFIIGFLICLNEGFSTIINV